MDHFQPWRNHIKLPMKCTPLGACLMNNANALGCQTKLTVIYALALICKKKFSLAEIIYFLLHWLPD